MKAHVVRWMLNGLTPQVSPAMSLTDAMTFSWWLNRQRPFHQAEIEELAPVKEDEGMLVLSRKVGDRIIIAPNIALVVLSIRGNVVRVGIDAPPEVKIHRAECLEYRPGRTADGFLAETNVEDLYREHGGGS